MQHPQSPLRPPLPGRPRGCCWRGWEEGEKAASGQWTWPGRSQPSPAQGCGRFFLLGRPHPHLPPQAGSWKGKHRGGWTGPTDHRPQEGGPCGKGPKGRDGSNGMSMRMLTTSAPPRLGTEFLSLHQTQETGWEGLLSMGQGLLPGMKAGNCKGKFDTNPSPAWPHAQAAAVPTKRGAGEGRRQTERPPGGSGGCRTRQGVCSSPN